jgi:hypothetical protein
VVPPRAGASSTSTSRQGCSARRPD